MELLKKTNFRGIIEFMLKLMEIWGQRHVKYVFKYSECMKFEII